MALQLSLTTKEGFEATEAYVVVERCAYRKASGKIMGMARAYINKAGRDAGNDSFKMFRVNGDFDFEGDNIVAQLYAIFKENEELAGAIDI